MSARVAILVGAGRYEHDSLPPLAGVPADLDALEAVLADPEVGGFEVVRLEDRPVREVQERVARACRERAREDLVLVYYSGMGFLDERSRLQLPLADSDPNLGQATSMSVRFVLEELDHSPAEAGVLIVDCCHSGAALRGLATPDGVVVLTSAGPDNAAYDTPQGSPFTAALAEGLRTGRADLDGDGKVDFEELHRFARSRLQQRGEPYDQRPRLFQLVEHPPYAGRVVAPVFVSYAGEDEEHARRIVERLEAAGHRTWRDDRLQGGDPWRDELVEALSSARAVVFVVSRAGLASQWTRRELEHAERNAIPVVPVCVEECEQPPWYQLVFAGVQTMTLDDDVAAAVTRRIRSRGERA